MNCLCLKKRKVKKVRNSGINKAGDGVSNVAYSKDEEDEDILADNVVLAELEEIERAKAAEEAPASRTSNASTQEKSSTLHGEQMKAATPVSIHSSVGSSKVARDDLCIGEQAVEYKEVSLISKDSAGLGVSLSGTVSDGIIVSELSEKGPAAQSGKIALGDRILSVTISFENMVYEDALTILSYASPYPVTLHLAKGSKSTKELQIPTTPKGTTVKQNKVFHPVYRSQSLGGSVIKSKKQKKLLPPRPGTSLDQLVSVRPVCNSRATSDDSLQHLLIKDKFRDTLNLTGGSDMMLHNTKDSDITSMSDRSETYRQSISSISNTSLIESRAEIDLIVTVAVDPVSDDTARQVQAPEKPKRTYAVEKDLPQKAVLLGQSETIQESDIASMEEVIIPTLKHKKSPAIDLVDGPAVARVPKLKVNGKLDIEPELISSQPVLTNNQQKNSLSVEEEIIIPSNKPKVQSSLIARFESTSIAKQQAGQADYKTDQEEQMIPLHLLDDSELVQEYTYSTELTAPEIGNVPSYEPANKDQQDDVQNVAIEENTAHSSLANDHQITLVSRSSESSPTSQHEPTESKKMVNENTDSLTAESSTMAASDSSSHTDNESSMLTQSGKYSETRRSTSFLSSETPRSSFMLRGMRSSKSEEDVDSDLMKTSTRIQLEAARARFFAELMQSSDLFKDSTTNTFSLNSESEDTQFGKESNNNNELDNEPSRVGKSQSLNSLAS